MNAKLKDLAKWHAFMNKCQIILKKQSRPIKDFKESKRQAVKLVLWV